VGPAPVPSVETSVATPVLAAPTDPLAVRGIVVQAMAWFDPDEGLLVGADRSEGGNGLIWRTRDGGSSWTEEAVAFGPIDAVSIVGDSAWLGVSCPYDGEACKPGIWASADRGHSWESVSIQPVIAVAYADENHAWAVSKSVPGMGGPDSTLLSSEDGGRTWADANVRCPAWTGLPAAVSFPDATHGWLACNGIVGAGNAMKAILATTEGSDSWDVRASAPWPGKGPVVGRLGHNGYLHGLAMRASGVGMNWQGRGITEKTIDGGRTWLPTPPGDFDIVLPSAGWLLDDENWLLYLWDGIAAQPALELSTDAGASWEVVSIVPQPES
jgi:photosystem II stability/assembly factor-like uncharacterized protein